MADRIEDGGPAYPSTEEHPNYDFPMHYFGMSLRDYFAGQALAGYFAAPNTNHRNTVHDETAEYMYAIADAMLSARARQIGLSVGSAEHG